VFAADGWLTSGYCSAWSLVLFSSLGSDYESFGWAAAAAALVSAAVSLACGRALDRGGRHRYLRLASAATVASLLFRAFSLGSAPLSVLANMTGAVVTALYNPVVMSVVYARAKASGKPYGFQLALEAAWDAGFVGGCLTSAAVAVCSPFPSLCVLPSVLGVIVVHLCIARLRPAADSGHGSARLAAAAP
jgi:MFS family permease